MAILRHATFQRFVAEKFQELSISVGQPRRIGVRERAADVVQYIDRDLSDVYQRHKNGSISPASATTSISELVLELTSFLYAAGAEHPVWRRWSGLTACGKFLIGGVYEAAQYAAVGGEWYLLKALPPATVSSNQTADLVLARLIWNGPHSELPRRAADKEDDAWLQLASSIPARDHTTTEAALTEIADFWMAETEGNWRQFHPRSYPDFHLPACAAAAIARHHGFVPSTLGSEQYFFLEAGLAVQEPAPLFPAYFSLPEPGKGGADAGS